MYSGKTVCVTDDACLINLQRDENFFRIAMGKYIVYFRDMIKYAAAILDFKKLKGPD